MSTLNVESTTPRSHTRQQIDRITCGDLASIAQYLSQQYPTQFVDSLTVKYDATTNTTTVEAVTVGEKYPGQYDGKERP